VTADKAALKTVTDRIANLEKSTKAAEDAERKREGDKLFANLTADIAE